MSVKKIPEKVNGINPFPHTNKTKVNRFFASAEDNHPDSHSQSTIESAFSVNSSESSVLV